jgi:hypothetical protein
MKFNYSIKIPIKISSKITDELKKYNIIHKNNQSVLFFFEIIKTNKSTDLFEKEFNKLKIKLIENEKFNLGFKLESFQIIEGDVIGHFQPGLNTIIFISYINLLCDYHKIKNLTLFKKPFINFGKVLDGKDIKKVKLDIKFFLTY